MWSILWWTRIPSMFGLGTGGGGGGGGRTDTPSHSKLGILSWSSIPSRGRVEIPPSHSMLGRYPVVD